MAIPSRQIGWGTTDNLLWQISRQLEYLTQVIAHPPVSTTSTTSTTTTTTTISPSTYTIGEAAEGGIIAYILQPGDPGYDAGVQHGLVAATSDQSEGIQWYNGVNMITGATNTAIGDGLTNTNIIISIQGAIETDYAAGLAKAYLGGGYTDWYLPSKDELNTLYLNKTAIGGFALTYYWSSTEIDSVIAWNQNFSNGFQNSFVKSLPRLVRAIRSF